MKINLKNKILIILMLIVVVFSFTTLNYSVYAEDAVKERRSGRV